MESMHPSRSFADIVQIADIVEMISMKDFADILKQTGKLNKTVDSEVVL